MVEGLWSQWFMVHVGALYWVTGGSSDWSERTALCTHCFLLYVHAQIHMHMFVKTKSKSESVHIYQHVGACHLNLSAHQITVPKWPMFLVLLKAKCAFVYYQWKAYLDQWQETKIKGVLPFVKTRDNRYNKEYTPLWFLCLFVFQPRNFCKL